MASSQQLPHQPLLASQIPAQQTTTTNHHNVATKQKLTGFIFYSLGVKSYEVSLENQTATVVAEPTLDYTTVLKTIAKTGKKVNKGVADGVEQSIEVPAEA